MLRKRIIDLACLLLTYIKIYINVIYSAVAFRDNKRIMTKRKKIYFCSNKINHIVTLQIVLMQNAVICSRARFQEFSDLLFIYVDFHSFFLCFAAGNEGFGWKDISNRPVVECDGRGSSDDCSNMLTSTNYEPFEFEHASRVTAAFWPRPRTIRRYCFFEQITIARGWAREKAQERRLFGELSASFKVHESTREIGSTAALIRGLK